MTKEQYQAAEALMDDITDVDYQIRSMEGLRGAGGISIVPTQELEYDSYEGTDRKADSSYFQDLDNTTTQKVLDVIINGLREQKKALERKFETL